MSVRIVRSSLFLCVLCAAMVFVGRCIARGDHAQSKLVFVYGRDACPYCVRAKNLLSDKGVRYVYYDLEVTPEKAKEAFCKLESGERPTVPQVFIEKEYVGGFGALRALCETGEIWDRVS